MKNARCTAAPAAAATTATPTSGPVLTHHTSASTSLATSQVARVFLPRPFHTHRLRFPPWWQPRVVSRLLPRAWPSASSHVRLSARRLRLASCCVPSWFVGHTSTILSLTRPLHPSTSLNHPLSLNLSQPASLSQPLSSTFPLSMPLNHRPCRCPSTTHSLSRCLSTAVGGGLLRGLNDWVNWGGVGRGGRESVCERRLTRSEGVGGREKRPRGLQGGGVHTVPWRGRTRRRGIYCQVRGGPHPPRYERHKDACRPDPCQLMRSVGGGNQSSSSSSASSNHFTNGSMSRRKI